MNYYLQKYATHQLTYFIYYFFSRQFQKCKNYQNPTSTSGDTYKTILLFYLNCFLLATHLNLKRLKKHD